MQTAEIAVMHGLQLHDLLTDYSTMYVFEYTARTTHKAKQLRAGAWACEGATCLTELTGAWPYNHPCAQQYVGKSQSCMVISGRLIVHAPVQLGWLIMDAGGRRSLILPTGRRRLAAR